MTEIRRIRTATLLLGEYLLLARDWRRDVWELTARLKDGRGPFVPKTFQDLEDAKRQAQVIATQLGVLVINVIASLAPAKMCAGAQIFGGTFVLPARCWLR